MRGEGRGEKKRKEGRKEKKKRGGKKEKLCYFTLYIDIPWSATVIRIN